MSRRAAPIGRCDCDRAGQPNVLEHRVGCDWRRWMAANISAPQYSRPSLPDHDYGQPGTPTSYTENPGWLFEIVLVVALAVLVFLGATR